MSTHIKKSIAVNCCEFLDWPSNDLQTATSKGNVRSGQQGDGPSVGQLDDVTSQVLIRLVRLAPFRFECAGRYPMDLYDPS